MDEFTANSILNAAKTIGTDYTMKSLGNVIQIDWDVFLPKYSGKLKFEVNLNPNTEIRISLHEVFERACLRRLEVPLNSSVSYSHRNVPACGNTLEFDNIHKHTFRDRVKDGCAYVPNDIDERSLESIVRTFAAECNITFTAFIPPILNQRTLF
jgi:hypothetical protein